MKKTVSKKSNLKIYATGNQLWLPQNLQSDREQKEPSLISMKPYGIHVSPEGMRPLLLFKDEQGSNTVAVGLSSVDAAVTLAQSNPTMAGSPHRFAADFLNSMNIRIQRAVFTEIKNGQQFVRLDFENHPTTGSLQVRADESMSLCMHLNVPFFATKEFIAASRTFLQDMHGPAQLLTPDPRLLQKNNGYLM